MEPQEVLPIYLERGEQLEAAMSHLAQKYLFPIATQIPSSPYLAPKDGRFQLVGADQKNIFFDLAKNYYKFLYQRKKGGLGPLAKALGKDSVKVLDVTCGSGADSMFMLALGMEVYAFERNPVVAILLEDAFRYYKAMEDDFSLALNRLHFRFGDPCLHGFQLPQVDVIYYDPMFPEKKKSSALARKEMELFKLIVGKDEDEVSVLASLLKITDTRIIVKRPLKAEPLKEKPLSSFTGKTTRYDLYKSPS